MAKPSGHPGSWFAEWQGEQLPCVHQHWTKGSWPLYVDPGFDGRSKWNAFVEALQLGKKAILTTSHPPDANGKRRRKSYIAVYIIDDVKAANGQLRFTFRDQLQRF